MKHGEQCRLAETRLCMVVLIQDLLSEVPQLHNFFVPIKIAHSGQALLSALTNSRHH